MKQDLGPLGTADLLTQKELNESMGHHFDLLIQRFYRADKYMRLPLVLGIAAAGSLNIASTVGPRQGYAWDISHFGVAGLASGDVVGIQFAGGPPLNMWQLTAANPVNTFSRGQMVMLPGETLTVVNIGTFTSTAQITLYGQIRTEAPAEKMSAVLA